MSALPASLKPWATQLSILSHELALSLGPWVQRIASSVGARVETPGESTGAPDGYDGLANKGSFERLLTSEWLYAEEAPDEFLRRATQSELLFSRLAARQPHQTRHTLVLFDSGPSQLGTPRIAHLAALIAFASRSDASQAQLSWGIVQQAPVYRRTGLDRVGIEVLLVARTTKEATDADLAAWMSAEDSDDVWLVGDGRLTAPRGSRVQHIAIAEMTKPSVRALEVSVRREGRTRRSVQLELPTPQVCTALLRNPFPAPKRKKAPENVATRGLVFARSRLFSLGEHGELISIVVPHKPGDVPQHVFEPPEGETIVAAGWHQGLMCATASGFRDVAMSFVVHQLTKRGARRLDPIPFKAGLALFATTSGSLSGLATSADAGARSFEFVMADHHLTLAKEHFTIASERVLAHALVPHRLVLLSRDADNRLQLSHWGKPTVFRQQLPEAARAFIASSQLMQKLVCAVGPPPGLSTWTLIDLHSEPFSIEVPSGGIVVGVAPPSTWPAALLVLSDHRRRLLHVSRNETRQIVETTLPIVEVASDATVAQIAWLDSGSEVGIFNLDSPAHRLHLDPPHSGRRTVRGVKVEP